MLMQLTHTHTATARVSSNVHSNNYFYSIFTCSSFVLPTTEPRLVVTVFRLHIYDFSKWLLMLMQLTHAHTATARVSSNVHSNNYFYSIFTRSSFLLPTTDELPSIDSLVSDVSVSVSDVYSELTKLDTSKAMGTDNIRPNILIFCAPALYLPIHHLFSLSLSHQCLPAEWCIHSIVPVFKSGDRL